MSPIVEIGECVRALERPGNALYQWNFVKDLKRRMRRKDRIRPGLFDLERLAAVRTVREFDEVYTAPYFGFRSADDYYHRASSIRIIDRIAVPTLVITAEDDPFVPSQPFHDPKLTGNPHIDLRVCEHGGHCGFVGPSTGPGDDGYWAETIRSSSSSIDHAGCRRSDLSAGVRAAQHGAERASHDRAPHARADGACRAFRRGVDQAIATAASRTGRPEQNGRERAAGRRTARRRRRLPFDSARAFSFSYADSRSIVCS